jgi:competence protein ComEC
LKARLETLLNSERDRWFLWVPVALGLGSASYFGLPAEPVLPVIAGFAAVLVFLGFRCRNWLPGGFLVVLAAAYLCGLTVAKIRTELLRAPVLTGQHAGVTIEGWLDGTRPRRDGGINIMLRVSTIDRLDVADTPYRVRLNLRDPEKLAGYPPGTSMRVRAWIAPPPGPATPGGYNFARTAWYARIGAIGVAHSLEAWPEGADRQSFIDNLGIGIDRIRASISERVRQALPGESGGIAVALITGDRSGLSRENIEILRVSGLAHVLAISGLHMSLVAGALFAGLRAFLALFPPLVLRFPVKKIAAFVAILAGAFYLALSGANIATQRAFIMVAIMLVAILLERPAITLRNVALAAMFIILWRPESVVSASFQMSFAAVTALVAAYERLEARRQTRARTVLSSLPARIARIVLLYFGGVMLTTLVASAATAPFAAYHFHRVVPFSLAGNLLAMPVIALAVMPLALIAVIAMGFGIELWPLHMMGQGIDLVLDLAGWVSSWPGAEQPVAAMPDSALVLMILGGLWLMLWRQRWRYAGVGGLAAGLLLALNPSPPDILIDARARSFAVRGDDGRFQMLVRTRSTFAIEQWLERDGDLRAIEQIGNDQFVCDSLACTIDLPGGGTMAIVNHRAALAEECRAARIVIMTFKRQGPCPGPELVIDEQDLEDEGAAAIWTRGAGFELNRASPRQSARPWTRGRTSEPNTNNPASSAQPPPSTGRGT